MTSAITMFQLPSTQRRTMRARIRHLHRRGILAPLIAAVLVSGCSGPLSPSDTEQPEQLPPLTQREWSDIAYATTSPAQRLDLRLPPAGEGPFPLVLWVHGGGWKGGDKRLAPDTPQLALLERGFAVASVNYRLSFEATFPAQIHDVKTSVRWLRANAARFHLDTANFGAWGGSAGGHLVSLLGTSGGVTELEGSELGNATQSSRVVAVVDWYGPADLVDIEEDFTAASCPMSQGLETVTQFLGGAPAEFPVAARLASPITWVSADDPPFLIQQGTEDCTVPWTQSRKLYDALVEAIGPAQVSLTLLKTGHGGVEFRADSSTAPIFAFFEDNLRSAAVPSIRLP